MAPRLPEFQERLDNAFRHWVGLWRCSVQDQELDSVIPLGVFHDSVSHGICGSRSDIGWCQT